MIIACPACQERFLVDDAALGGAAGRRVRCARCGANWLHSPDSARPAAAVVAPAVAADATAPPTAATPEEPARDDAALRAEGPPPGLPVPLRVPAPAWRGAAWVVGVGLIVVAAASVSTAIFAHDRIVTLWPPAGAVYDTIRDLTARAFGERAGAAEAPAGPAALAAATDSHSPAAENADHAAVEPHAAPPPTAPLAVEHRDSSRTPVPPPAASPAPSSTAAAAAPPPPVAAAASPKPIPPPPEKPLPERWAYGKGQPGNLADAAPTIRHRVRMVRPRRYAVRPYPPYYGDWYPYYGTANGWGYRQYGPGPYSGYGP